MIYLHSVTLIGDLLNEIKHTNDKLLIFSTLAQSVVVVGAHHFDVVAFTRYRREDAHLLAYCAASLVIVINRLRIA